MLLNRNSVFLLAFGVGAACSPTSGPLPPRGGIVANAGAGPTSGGTGGTGGATSTLGGATNPATGGMAPLGTGGKVASGGSGGLTASGGTGGGSGGTTTTGGTGTGGTAAGGTATGGMSAAAGGTQNITCPAQGTGGLASLATGLIGYWKFEDGTSGTTTADDSGMNHPGTYTATKPAVTTSVPTQLAGSTKALVFNGSSSWVALPSGSFGNWSATTSYSISAWVSVTAFDGDWQGVIANESASGNYCGLYIGGANGGVLNAFRYEGNDSGFGSTIPTPGVWYHVALVQDVTGNQQRLYVNGQPAGTGGLKDCSTTGVFFLGNSDGTANGAFNGSLDDVRFYSRALTGPEVAALACGSQ